MSAKGNNICTDEPTEENLHECATHAVGPGKEINRKWSTALLDKIYKQRKSISKFHDQLVQQFRTRLRNGSTPTQIFREQLYEIATSMMNSGQLGEDDYLTLWCYLFGEFSNVIYRILHPVKRKIFYQLVCYKEIGTLIRERNDTNVVPDQIENTKKQVLKLKSYIALWIQQYHSEAINNQVEYYDELIKEAVESELGTKDKITQALTPFIEMYIKYVRTNFPGRDMTPDESIVLSIYFSSLID
ncbi:hypothetical protein RF11_01408 [Thelohanellus kitauei]|uniref:Uncharacterized protein n=1 Tax=Thelohanellus kitauei TaxID=669202 RepID=A0A0C2JR35_THEKT|nr:hypothetical protein RF11_01408 [Thelohanellus kitauei]